MSHQPVIIKKKKSHDHGGHHGGSWKVAYADFVTAMMAFFMVMWIMGLSDDTRSIVAGYFNDPMGFMKNEPRSKTVITMPGMKASKPGEDRDGSKPLDDKSQVKEMQKDIEKNFKNLAAGSTDISKLLQYVSVKVTTEGLRMEFMEDKGAVFFESGSATIRPLALQLIASIAPIVKESGRDLKLEGHTDAAPYRGSGYDNYRLGSDRANAFRIALLQDGIPDAQFAEVTSYADKQPLFPEDPLHFGNRRVSLLLKFKKESAIVTGRIF